MITVTLVRDNNKAITGFSISGHAKTAPHGHDIVCAGVSVLAQAAVMGIERHLKREIDLEQQAGNLSMRLIEQPDALTGAVLETMLLGLTEIARLYPKSVRILEHRR